MNYFNKRVLFAMCLTLLPSLPCRGSVAMAVKTDDTIFLGCDSKVVGYDKNSDSFGANRFDKWLEIPEKKLILLYAGKLIRSQTFRVDNYRELLVQADNFQMAEEQLVSKLDSDLNQELKLIQTQDAPLFNKQFAGNLVFEFILAGFEKDQPMVTRRTFVCQVHENNDIAFTIFPFRFPGLPPADHCSLQRPFSIGTHAAADENYFRHFDPSDIIGERCLYVIDKSICEQAVETPETVGLPVNLWRLNKTGIHRIDLKTDKTKAK